MVRSRTDDVRLALGAGVLRVGANLCVVPSDLHGYLWQEIRDHELQLALYGQGDCRSAGPMGNVLTTATGGWTAVFMVASALNMIAACLALFALNPMRKKAIARES